MATNGGRRSSWWADTIKREETVNKELTLQIDNRRRRSSTVYGDLNSLLVNKDRLTSLSASRDNGRGGGSSKSVIKTKEIAEAIDIALATGCRVFTTAAESITKTDILDFLRKIFHLTDVQLERAQTQASQQPPSKLQLMCRVIKATELKSKDGNGTHIRSPYCRLGIVNQRHIETSSEFKFLSEWQKAGALADVASTSTKPATVEPVWNEDVKLVLENIEEDMIVVELWDDVHQEPRKNLKTLISHNKEEFLSWTSHPVHLVPIAGEQSQFTLTSRSKKTHKGFISMFLSIQADTDKQLEARFHEHQLLTRALINEGSKDGDSNGHSWNWNGTLGSEAEKLLEYHGSLNGLHKLQMASVLLSELLKYQGIYGVEIQAFNKLILEIKKLEQMYPLVQQVMPMEKDPQHPVNSSSSPVPHALHQIVQMISPPMVDNSYAWEKQLFSDLDKLESDLMDMLNDHIRLVQFGYDGDVEKINLLLSTLKELYSIEAYDHQLESKRSFSSQLESCIVPSVKSWFSLLKTRVMPSLGSEQKELRDLCSHCLLWTEKAQEQLHPKFMELAGVDYFTNYLVALDEMLSSEVVTLLEDHKGKRVEAYTFEMYTTFQQFVELSQHIEKEAQSKLSFLTFHKWFEEFVAGWIKLSREKCESRIQQAIQLDEIVKITKDLKLSTSAVDTRGFLHQMAAFWQHLDWPVASEAYGFAVSMIENMCCCAEFYVGKIFGSLNSESLQDEHGRFKASEKLCLVINNMYYIREFLSELPVHMELDNFYARLEKEEKMRESNSNGGSEVANSGMSLTVRAKILIGNFVATADEVILKKVNDVARKICNKLTPDIQEFVNKIIKRKQDESKDKLLNPLLDYLTQNLTTLGNNLLPSVFESFTAILWEVSVGAVEQLSKVPRKKDILVQQRLLDTLNSLRDFYYCEGEGVSGRALDCDVYLTLRSKLNILRMPTNQLIVHFYSELMKHQREKTGKGGGLGEMVVSVGYIKEVSAIEVIVVQARDIELCHEPYVKLRLSSTCKSADKHWKTKPIKGGSRAPSFSEEFLLSATEAEMMSEGTQVIFYLLDKKLKSKSHIGMCAIACTEIPHLYHTSLKRSLSDPTAPQRKNFNLSLFQFSTETLALAELMARADSKDVNAARFMKMNELLLGNIPHHAGTKFGRSRIKTVE